MVLAARTRVGPYEIVAPLGEGGMGEVYRARDTQLDRDVALKILPDSFAADPDRLMRFAREAKTLASLNHPNIAAIYGIEGGALVMELVEGEDLAARIARGAVPFDEALAIARQIAEALDAAHDAGIIHRDLKPANIRLRPDGTVKVLDFGLAKAIEPAAGSDPHALPHSPTLTSPVMTQLGVILGTAAYMSPEQARGRPVDRRADVWAFGVILHETLTGERLFAADSIGDSIAAVLTREPDWRGVPAQVKPLLAACLEKDPRRRLRSIGDGLLLLDMAPATAGRSVRRPLLPWIAGALAISAVAAAAVWRGPFATEPPRAPLAFQEPAPAGTRLHGAPLVSPDGRSLALLARDGSGVTRIWTRALSEARARPLDGSEGASLMFWSPDSAEIAFTAGDELRRIPRLGGLARRVVAGTARSGVWTPGGEMVIATRAGLFRVPAEGGTPQQLLVGRPGSFVDLALLSSGHHLLFRQFGFDAGLYVLDLDSGDATRLDWAAAATATSGVVGYAAPDTVLYIENQGLVSRRLDPSNRSLAGDAFPVVDGIRQFAGSASGALTYVATAPVATRMTWRDRQGRPAGTFGPEGDYREVYISRDGQRVLYTAADPAGNLDLWIQDPRAPAANRLTSDPDVDHLAAFSPDGSEVIWEGHRAAGLTLFRQRSDGSGGIRTERVWNRAGGPSDWSPDGRFALYASQETGTGEDIWVVPMSDKTEPFALIASEFDETGGTVSPDGRWLAYASTASGRPEIYLQRLDGWRLVGGPMRVSSGGGEQPAWRSDGSELFYRANEALAVVPISGDAERPAGVPQVLFSLAGTTGGFAVAADGQRILVIEGDRETSDSAVVVMDWSSTMKTR